MKVWPTVKDLIHHHLGEQRGWRTVFHIPEWPWKYVLILFPPSKPWFCIVSFSCSCLVLRVLNIRPCMQFIANTHFYHTLVWLVTYDPFSLITADQLLTNGQLLYHVVLFFYAQRSIENHAFNLSISPFIHLSLYPFIHIYIYAVHLLLRTLFDCLMHRTRRCLNHWLDAYKEQALISATRWQKPIFSWRIQSQAQTRWPLGVYECFFFQPPTRVKTRGVGWLQIFPQESEFLQAYTEPAKFYWASTSGRFGCPPWLEENVSRPHEMGKTIGKPWENAELTMKKYDLINKNRDYQEPWWSM